MTHPEPETAAAAGEPPELDRSRRLPPWLPLAVFGVILVVFAAVLTATRGKADPSSPPPTPHLTPAGPPTSHTPPVLAPPGPPRVGTDSSRMGTATPRPVDTAVVPWLTGMTVTQATHALQTAQLRVGAVRYRTVTGRDLGTIIQQYPAAGTNVQPRTTVIVVVARTTSQPKTVVVPNVIGNSEPVARDRLQRAGLEVEVQEVVTDATAPAGPPGSVAMQSLRPETVVKLGTLVIITIWTVSEPPVNPLPQSSPPDG